MTCPDCGGSGRQFHRAIERQEGPAGYSWAFEDIVETGCDCSAYVGLPPEDHAARAAADPEYVPF